MAVLSFASKTIKNISNTIQSRTTARKNLTSDILGIKNRRIERERRKEKEDEISAVSRVSFPKGAASLSLSQSGGSFISRILGFIGFVSAGWILSNARTWIAGGKELIGRIQSLESTFTGFVYNIATLMSDIGRVANAFYQNMLVFDFKDTDYRIGKSMQDLNTTLDSMNQQIFSAFNSITEPFTNVPPLGSKGEKDAYTREEQRQPSEQPTPSGGGGGGGLGGLSANAKALLNTIRWAEGTYTTDNSGYNTWFGGSKYGGDLSKKTIAEVVDLQKRFLAEGRGRWKGGNSAAVGAYQMIQPDTFAKRAGFDINKTYFTPEVQDKLAIAGYMKGQARMTDAEINAPISKQQIAKISGVWASLPNMNGVSAYGQPAKRYVDLEKKYNEFLGNNQISQQQSNQQRPSSPQKPNVTPTTSIKPVVTSRYGVIRKTGRHGGTDLAVDYGTPLRAVSDGKIVETGWESGWGYFLVYRDTNGYYHLYGHMVRGSYKTSGDVKKGEMIGRVGTSGRSTGPHLHWEMGKSWTGVIGEKFDPLNLYSSTAPFSGISQSSPSSTLTPSAPSVTTPTADNQAQVEPEQKTFLDEFLAIMSSQKKGQEVVVINDVAPSSPSQTIMMSGGSSGSSVNESEVLNSFIKNKLLLDLNYL